MGDRGRTASYPTAPSQTPACGITAPGSSELFAWVPALSKGPAQLFWQFLFRDSWLLYPKVFQKFVKSCPCITLALASPIQALKQSPHRLIVE